MKKEYAAVCLGEVLVDIVSRTDESGTRAQMEGNPGGAPANVMAMMRRLGYPTAVIGKVGSDSFGQMVKQAISQAGVDCSGILTDALHPTTLAMVSLNAQGNRSFHFYRSETADIMLSPEEVRTDLIDRAEIFVFGSVTLSAQPVRSATFAAAEYARAHGVTVAYDPNLRRPLWKSADQAREMLCRGMEYADLAKVSDEELFFLMGDGAPEERALALLRRYSLRLLAVTMGADGCLLAMGNRTWRARTFDTPVRDTTGAGDAFWGAMLACFLRLSKPAEQLEDREIRAMLDFCNAAGSLTCTKYGAIPALPTEEEIQACMQTVPYLSPKRS